MSTYVEDNTMTTQTSRTAVEPLRIHRRILPPSDIPRLTHPGNENALSSRRNACQLSRPMGEMGASPLDHARHSRPPGLISPERATSLSTRLNTTSEGSNTQNETVGLGITYPRWVTSTPSEEATSGTSGKAIVPVKSVNTPQTASHNRPVQQRSADDSSRLASNTHSSTSELVSNSRRQPASPETHSTQSAHSNGSSSHRRHQRRGPGAVKDIKGSRRNPDPLYLAQLLAQWNSYANGSFDWLERECKAEGIDMEDTAYYRILFEERSPNSVRDHTPIVYTPAIMEEDLKNDEDDDALSSRTSRIVFKNPFSAKSKGELIPYAVDSVSPLTFLDPESTPRFNVRALPSPAGNAAHRINHTVQEGHGEILYETNGCGNGYLDPSNFSDQDSFELLDPFANMDDLTRYPSFSKGSATVAASASTLFNQIPPESASSANLCSVDKASNRFDKRNHSEPMVLQSRVLQVTANMDHATSRTRAYTSAADAPSTKSRGRFLIQLTKPFTKKPSKQRDTHSKRHFLSMIARPRAFSGPVPTTVNIRKQQSPEGTPSGQDAKPKPRSASQGRGSSNWRPPTCWDMPEWQPSVSLRSQNEITYSREVSLESIADVTEVPITDIDPNSTPTVAALKPAAEYRRNSENNRTQKSPTLNPRRVPLPKAVSNSTVANNYSRPSRPSLPPNNGTLKSTVLVPSIASESEPSTQHQPSLPSHGEEATYSPDRYYNSSVTGITPKFNFTLSTLPVSFLPPNFSTSIFRQPEHCETMDSGPTDPSRESIDHAEKYATLPKVTMKAKRSLPIGVPRTPYCIPSFSRSFTHIRNASSPHLDTQAGTPDLSKYFSSSVSHLGHGA